MNQPSTTHKCTVCGWFCEADGTRLMPSLAELKRLLDCESLPVTCRECVDGPRLMVDRPQKPAASTVPSTANHQPSTKWNYQPAVGEEQLPVSDRRETTD